MDGVLTVILGLLVFIFGVGIGVISTTSVYSKEAIKPNYRIEINEGVVDTTFIYKLK